MVIGNPLAGAVFKKIGVEINPFEASAWDCFREMDVTRRRDLGRLRRIPHAGKLAPVELDEALIRDILPLASDEPVHIYKYVTQHHIGDDQRKIPLSDATSLGNHDTLPVISLCSMFGSPSAVLLSS
jgi:hypothetical protein